MAITLHDVAQAFLTDEEFQKKWRRFVESRNESILRLQAVTQSFIAGYTDLQAFRAELERALRAGEGWGATGFGFMMVAARNSAFIISLFAFWLDSAGQPIIYYDSLRKGLYQIVKADLKWDFNLIHSPTLQ